MGASVWVPPPPPPPREDGRCRRGSEGDRLTEELRSRRSAVCLARRWTSRHADGELGEPVVLGEDLKGDAAALKARDAGKVAGSSTAALKKVLAAVAGSTVLEEAELTARRSSRRRAPSPGLTDAIAAAIAARAAPRTRRLVVADGARRWRWSRSCARPRAERYRVEERRPVCRLDRRSPGSAAPGAVLRRPGLRARLGEALSKAGKPPETLQGRREDDADRVRGLEEEEEEAPGATSGRPSRRRRRRVATLRRAASARGGAPARAGERPNRPRRRRLPRGEGAPSGVFRSRAAPLQAGAEGPRAAVAPETAKPVTGGARTKNAAEAAPRIRQSPLNAKTS